jgi:tellurite resistance protein TerC
MKFIRKSKFPAKKFFITVLGGAMVLIGIAMIFLPGPAFVMIPAGLAILATQYQWARRWLNKVKQYGKKVIKRRRSA